jgi:serine/threonine protein phosphatase PrpC
MLFLRAAALTDIGRVRRENEDRFLFDEEGMAFGVADGVGGLPGGAQAAELAITLIADALQTVPAGRDPDLVTIVCDANRTVAEIGMQLSPNLGIGTTLTVGCVRKGVFHIAHVGDSRCYLSRAGKFTCLTQDHSVENEARLRRARGEVVYYHEANRNALTRCIGQPVLPDVDVIVRPLAAGDRYLFCTDGVTRTVSDADLASLMEKFDAPQPALEAIVKLALRRGGPDNVTGVLVFVDTV